MHIQVLEQGWLSNYGKYHMSGKHGKVKKCQKHRPQAHGRMKFSSEFINTSMRQLSAVLAYQHMCAKYVYSYTPSKVFLVW